jgi:hypothetical protein
LNVLLSTTGIFGEQKMKLYRGISMVILASFLVMGLSACEKEGSAEKAGKAIDEAASDVAEKAKDAKEAVEEKMEKQ